MRDLKAGFESIQSTANAATASHIVHATSQSQTPLSSLVDPVASEKPTPTASDISLTLDCIKHFQQ